MRDISTDVASAEGSEVLTEIHTAFSLDEYDEGREIAENAGLVQYGEGTGRVVYKLPGKFGPQNVVVKVSKNMVGVHANQTEVHTFERADSEVREFLAPVAGSGEWVVMPECNPGDEEAVDDIKFYFLNEGVYCADSEIRVENMGWLNGRPVMVDYGFGLEF